MRIEGPIELAQNAAFAPLVAIAELGDAKRGILPDGKTWWCEPSVPSMIPIELVVPWLSYGGSVPSTAGYPAWLLIDAATYAGDVTDGISNRSYRDDQDNEIIRTWSQWKISDAYQHVAANAGSYKVDPSDTDETAVVVSAGDMIVPGVCWGQQLSAAELALAHQTTGITILSKDQYAIAGLHGSQI